MLGLGQLLLQGSQLGVDGLAALLQRLELALQAAALLRELLLSLVVLRPTAGGGSCGRRGARRAPRARTPSLRAVLAVSGLQPVIDAADMLGDLAATELIDAAHQPIEELAVVRDDDDRAREA